APVRRGMPAPRDTAIRVTVHWPLGGVVVAPAGRLRTFETKIAACEPLTDAVRSQGPLMSGLDHVSTSRPKLSRTSRHPTGLALKGAPDGPAAGMLPTTTQPPGRIASAVPRPMPPGHDMPAGTDASSANTLA